MRNKDTTHSPLIYNMILDGSWLVSKNFVCTIRIRIHIVGCNLCLVLVSVQLDIGAEGIKIRALAAMICWSLIGSEVLARGFRIVCATSEDATEVRFEEWAECRYASADHGHHCFDRRPNDEVANRVCEITISLLKVGNDASETDDADNATGGAHSKYKR